jgi:hypothetical protein
MGSVLVNIAGSGRLTSIVWTNTDIGNVCNPWVYYNGYIYGIGSASGQGLICMNASTGAKVWNSADSGKQYDTASGLILANDKLIAVNDEWDATYTFMMGDIVVVPATPTGYSETYRTNGIVAPLNGDYCWTAPTLSNGKLYLRTYQGILTSFDVSAPSQPAEWIQHYYPGSSPTNYDAIMLSDTDGDGMPAWQEYIVGTDPTNRSSSLKAAIALSKGKIVITYPMLAATGTYYTGMTRYYGLESATQLLNAIWQGVPNETNTTGSTSTVVYTNSFPDSRRFFRAKAKLP